ncbi:dTDP-4-dehydrorhamnose 3,5-epimerase family protein [Patescibacteria group bacterium]|nr:dTDP-4-dehydrorhamnose 3,5-epimerase family protein [Patescibacteria group bacterium]
MIDGVEIKKLKVMKDKRGFLMEMLRNDDEMFDTFGQVYMTGVKKGYAKAWHYHKGQIDRVTCVLGQALWVMYDARKNSPTYKEVQEVIMTDPTTSGEQVIVKVPIGVLHGFTAHNCDEARIVNVPNQKYDYEEPDELRYPWNSEEVNYKWPDEVKDGG